MKCAKRAFSIFYLFSMFVKNFISLTLIDLAKDEEETLLNNIEETRRDESRYENQNQSKIKSHTLHEKLCTTEN